MGQPLEPGTFHGRILGARGASGFRLTEVTIEPERRLPRHSHQLAFFCLLLEGGYREDYGSRTVSYLPFTVAFHPPGELHRSEMCPIGARLFNVEVPARWLEFSGVGPSPPYADVSGGELTWLATRLFREYREGAESRPLAVQALVVEMLAVAKRRAAFTETDRPRWVPRVIDLLRSEFRQSLRIEKIAAEVGRNPVHLARMFRKRVGVPIGEYVHRVRVRFACEELRKPDARLADVAAAAGFADQSHMTRVFKRVTGVTPGDFRNGVRSPLTTFDRNHLS